MPYKTCEEACKAFIDSSGYHTLIPNSISFYVPGKFPREDGNPYLIGSGWMDTSSYTCVKGYFNLFNTD